MKNILLFCCLLIAGQAFAQYPVGTDSFNLQTMGSTKTFNKAKGAIGSDQGLINAHFIDTATANLSQYKIKNYPGAQIMVNDTIWVRNSTATKWDNLTGGNGKFYKLYTQLPLYIKYNAAGDTIIAILHDDGLVSGGIVTWSGTGLKFYVSPAIYVIGGIFYNSLLDSVTLDAADPTNPRFDLIGLDTTLHAFKLTGIPSPTPIVPQDTLLYQLALTSGISILPGATTPGNITFNTIYDENIEWANGTQGTITANFNDVSNPYTGTKDIFISKYNYGSGVYFQDANRDSLIQGDVLVFHLYLNNVLNNPMFLFFYDPLTGSQTNILYVTSNNGLNPNNINNYQTITIPLSSFNWNNNPYYQTLLIRMGGYDTTGAQGFYLDRIQIQHGNINLPRQLDWTTNISNDSLYQNINGAHTFIGIVSGGGGSTNLNIGSGYRIAVPGTNNLKTLFCAGCAIDSVSNANALTITAASTQTTNKLRVTATGGQTAFTFAGLPASTNDYDIFVNGAYVNPTYYSGAGTTITFGAGLIVGDVVDFAQKK